MNRKCEWPKNHRSSESNHNGQGKASKDFPGRQRNLPDSPSGRSGMMKPFGIRSTFLVASTAVLLAFEAMGKLTDYDVVCKGLTSAFETCQCATNPTSAVGYVIDTAFVECVRPEIQLNANFTGSERYLSSISVNQSGLSTRHVDLMLDANHTVTACQVTSYGRECDCTVCSTPGAGVSLDIDCNGVPGGGAASTNGTCATLLDLFQYSFDVSADGATSGAFIAMTGSSFAGPGMALATAAALIALHKTWL